MQHTHAAPLMWAMRVDAALREGSRGHREAADEGDGPAAEQLQQRRVLLVVEECHALDQKQQRACVQPRSQEHIHGCPARVAGKGAQ